MGTDKRQRKKANRAARLQAQQKAARRQGALRRIVLFVGITVGVLVLALLFSLFSGGDDDEGSSAAPALAVAVDRSGSASGSNR